MSINTLKYLDANIPFVDLKANYYSIKEEVDLAIATVLEEADFIKGKSLTVFEENWANVCNAKYAIGTSSGTSSIELILKAYGITSFKDEVICPSHTFIATAEAICNAGAKPVFADIDEKTLLIDPKSIKSCISKNTKAIIIVDLYGQPADYYGVKEVLEEVSRETGQELNIRIIQDAAQSHLGKYKGMLVGSYADATSFSFYPGKNLGAYGDAGSVVTNDEDLAKRVRMLSDHGRTTKYEHEIVGSNYRMDTIQAAVLDVKLRYLEKWVKARRNIARLYRKYLDKTKLEVLVEDRGVECAYHLFVVKVKKEKFDREGLRLFLKEVGIASGVHYPIPLHLQPAFKALGYKNGAFPVTERIVDQIISLPIYPEMTEDMVKYISEKVTEGLCFQEGHDCV